MFDFRKFPSLENFLTVADSLDMENIQKIDSGSNEFNWVATEKIDGSNIGIYISKNDWKIAKRNSFVEDDEDLNHVREIAKDSLKDFIKTFQETVSWDNIDYYILYGEFYGLGIQNRIYYGSKKSFKFFHVVYKIKESAFVDLTWNEIVSLFTNLNHEKMLVPVVGMFKTFKEAVSCANDLVSFMTDEEHNSIMEGLVIRPIYEKGFNTVSKFQTIIKSKNDKFKEQARTGIKKFDENSDYVILHYEFLNYITKNRMYSVFSKRGNPASMKEIGNYLKDFLEDAIEDFSKDFPKFNDLEEKEKKFVINIKANGFLLFKQVIRELDLKI